jgi:hypothetical protein
MLLMPNRKKAATMIIASMKGAPKSSAHPDFVQRLGEDSNTGSYKTGEDDDKDADMGLESAMEEFLSAVEAKDAAGMARALKDFWTMLEDGEEPEADAPKED